MIPGYARQRVRERCFRDRACLCVDDGFGDTRGYTGSDLSEDNNSTFCVCVIVDLTWLQTVF